MAAQTRLHNELVEVRCFKSFPAQEREKFLSHIKSEGLPELYDGLDTGPVPRDLPFEIVTNFSVSSKSRRSGDLIPCAMCSPNKFLEGSLIWLPDRESIALIGHCCANKENQRNANENYNYRTSKQRAEDYLLENVIFVPKIVKTIQEAILIAEKQQKCHRNLKKEFSELVGELRKTKKEGGVLQESVVESVEFAEARSSSAGKLQRPKTLLVSMGKFEGQTAVLSSYRPVQQLRVIGTRIGGFPMFDDEEEILDYIAALNFDDLTLAESHLKQSGVEYKKIRAKLLDFERFFSQSNIELINRWGNANRNDFNIALSDGARRLTGRNGIYHSFVQVPEKISQSSILWPIPNK